MEVDGRCNIQRPAFVIQPRSTQSGLVFVLHGVGDTADGMIEFAQTLAAQLPHVKFIVPTAPNVHGLGFSWYTNDAQGNMSDHIGAWYQLLQCIEEDRISFGLSLGRVAFIGFSQGSVMASWVALQLPYPCAGLVMLSGGCRDELQIPDEVKTTPVLYCNGVDDMVVPPSVTRSCCDRLRTSGLSIDYFEFPCLGHVIGREAIDAVLAFLRNCLPRETFQHEIMPEGGLSSLMQSIELQISTSKCATVDSPHGIIRIPDGIRVNLLQSGSTGVIIGFDADRRKLLISLSDGSRQEASMDEVSQRIPVKLLRKPREQELEDFFEREVELIGGEEGNRGVLRAYILQLTCSNRQASVFPDSVLLPVGAVFRLTGLTTARCSSANGRLCRIKSYSAAEGRYQVEIENDDYYTMRVWARNLRP